MITENDLQYQYHSPEVGDIVVINFGRLGILHDGVVIEKKYEHGQVNYDVKFYPFKHENGNEELFTVLKDVRGYFVEFPHDRFNGKSNMGNEPYTPEKIINQ